MLIAGIGYTWFEADGEIATRSRRKQSEIRARSKGEINVRSRRDLGEVARACASSTTCGGMLRLRPSPHAHARSSRWMVVVSGATPSAAHSPRAANADGACIRCALMRAFIICDGRSHTGNIQVTYSDLQWHTVLKVRFGDGTCHYVVMVVVRLCASVVVCPCGCVPVWLCARVVGCQCGWVPVWLCTSAPDGKYEAPPG